MPDALSLVILGLTYGVTVCSLTCLPYYGPYLLGSGSGFVDGIASSLCFALGKVCTYSIMGGVAAVIGRVFSLQHDHVLVMGIVLMAAALTLPLVSRKRGCCRRYRRFGRRGSLFVLGVVSSLLPCPPVAAVLVLAAGNGTLSAGMAYGFCYGLGIMLSPMLMIGGGLAMISEKISKEARGVVPYMQGMAMLIMMARAADMIMAA